jgi:hypothetical protein
MNLHGHHVSFVCRLVSCHGCLGRINRTTYFLKIPSSVLNLELSSAGLSTAAFEGVAALDVSLELRAEAVEEPGRALSAGRSAIAYRVCLACASRAGWRRKRG